MSQKRAKLNRQNKRMQLNLNPDDLPDVTCQKLLGGSFGDEVCGNKTFIDGKTIKRVSALVSPDGRDGYLNIGVSICCKCFATLPHKA